MKLLALCAAAAALAVSMEAAAPTQARPDTEIERDIRRRFAKSKISSNGFRVRVQSGIATLEGNTEIPQHKGVATRLARLGGAKSVDNRIEISEAGKSKMREATGKKAAPRSEPRSAPRSSAATPAQEPVPAAPRRAVVRRP